MSESEPDAQRAAVDWARVRADYEGPNFNVQSLCKHYRISVQALYQTARAQGWKPRGPGRRVSRRQLIGRLYGLVERQILEMEARLAETGEKEAALLGNLARTLEKLMELDAGQKRGRGRPESKDMTDLRAMLAKRIDQLAGE